MAQWRIDQQKKVEQNSKTLYELGMIATVDGNPVTNTNPFPVSLGGADITVSGNVNILSDVHVNNQEGDPVHIHLSEIGNSGILTVDYMPISGNVVVKSGNLSIYSGNVNAVVTGVVNVGNIPASQNVVITNTLLNANVTGYINVTNLPSSQNVTVTYGNLSIYSGNVSVVGVVNVGNIPTSQNVVVTSINSGNLSIYSGNVTVSGNVSVSNFPASQNVVVTSGNISATINSSANTPVLVKYADSDNTQLDAVGRLRIAPPIQSYWYTPSVDKDGDLRYQEAFQNNANSYFIQNLAQIRMTSGNTYNANTSLTGSAIRQTRRRFAMRPNVSLEWFGAINWSGAETNVTKRRGFFTQYNGVFFEVSGGDLSFVIRRRLENGTLVTKTIPRAEWNVERLDGTNSAFNPTGRNIDPATSAQTVTINSVASKTGPTSPQNSTEQYYTVTFNTSDTTSITWQLGQHVIVYGLTPSTMNGHGMVTGITTNTVSISYLGDPGTYSSGTGTIYSDGMYTSYSWWIDFDGSRTNRIRFGVQGKDGPQVCHIEDFTGLLGTRWSNAPAMPDRMEIFNTGAVPYNPALFIGSSSISTEAEVLLNPGFGLAIHDSHVTFDKTTAVGKEYAVLGVGLRAGEPYQRADLQVQRVQLTDIGNLNQQQAGIVQWRLVLNPTFSGNTIPSSVNVGKATRQWSYGSNTSISGGVTLLGGYFQGTQTQETQTALNFLNMGSNITNTDSDVIVLACKLLVGGSGDSKIAGGFDIIEAL